MNNRIGRLTERLPEVGADLLMVTSLINVRYLTGFTGSNAIALVGPDTRVFLTDFRYVEQAAAEVDPSFERLIVAQDLVDAVSEALPAGSPRLGFEDAHLTVRAHTRLRERVPGGTELV